MGGLTAGQIARAAALAGDQRVAGEQEGSASVERPDVRPACVQPDGRLAASTLVASVQSNLQVERC